MWSPARSRAPSVESHKLFKKIASNFFKQFMRLNTRAKNLENSIEDMEADNREACPGGDGDHPRDNDIAGRIEVECFDTPSETNAEDGADERVGSGDR